MRRLSIALFLLLAATGANAGESLVGEPAPPLGSVTWLTATEAQALEGFRGRVVVLLLGCEGHLTDDVAVKRLNDLRAAYLIKGLRLLAILQEQPDTLPAAIEFSVAVGPADAYGGGGTPRAVLIGADGKVAWDGEPDAVSDELIVKLLRQTKAFPLGPVDPAVKSAATAFKKGKLTAARELAGTLEHEDATQIAGRVDALLTFWQTQVERSAAAQNPAETACFLSLLAKHMAGAQEGTDAGEALKLLKKNKSAAKEIKAAASYVRLRGDWAKTNGKRKKIDAVVKKGERFVKTSAGTRGAERATRLIDAIRADPAVTALRAFIAKEKIKTKGANWRTGLPKPPKVEFDDSRDYLWQLDTSEGPITLRFFVDVAPMHVSSIIYLTELGFFDGLTFHRVMPGFMAQGGCPLGTGSGSPGYRFDGEFDPNIKHDRAGILSAAHSGPGTDGSQFFITFAPARHLDGVHTVYGETVKGLKTLEKLEKFATPGGTPTKRLVINKATIRVE